MKPDPGLLYLSLRHVYSCWRWTVQKFPHIPSNADRLRAYRSAITPETGNTYRWPWHPTAEDIQAREYAREAMQDSMPSDDHWTGEYADRRG